MRKFFTSDFLQPVEVFNTINQLKSNKSCGLDGIETKFVKIAAEIITFVLTSLYNYCFALRVFPSCLKTAKVILLFKCGEFQKLTNHRPISPIIVCLSNTLEVSSF